MDQPTHQNADQPAQGLDSSADWPYTKREYASRIVWAVVYRLLYRPSPRRAYAWRAFLLRCLGAKVPRTARVRPTTRIVFPTLLTMGEYASIGDNVMVYNLGPITLGDHALVSQNTHLCAGTHDYRDPSLPLRRVPITIGKGVWIAADAFIGPGVTIGDNCVVGARSVVCKDLEPGLVVAGNPARVIKRRSGEQAGGADVNAADVNADAG